MTQWARCWWRSSAPCRCASTFRVGASGNFSRIGWAHPAWVTDQDARRASRALVRPSPCAAGGTAYAYEWPAVAVSRLLIPKTGMSATTLNRALERMGFSRKHGIGSSAHAFRAAASTMFNGQGSRADLIECQLALAARNKTRAATTRLNILTTGNSCCSIVSVSSTTFPVPPTLHIRSLGGMTRSEMPTP